MKVLKFGGSSVGSVEGLSHIKQIVESQEEKVIVVVSALGDTTDDLIAISKKAEKGDAGYTEDLQKLIDYHHGIINSVISSQDHKDETLLIADRLFDELRSIYQGVCLIKDLSEKT